MTSSSSRDARLVRWFRHSLAQHDTAGFAARVSQYYTSESLLRLLCSTAPESRRAASMALGILGHGPEVARRLGRLLRDPDRGVRLAADDALRILWWRDASPWHQQQLNRVARLNDGGTFEQAARLAQTMTREAPRLCEAHYQLATAFFGLEQPGRALGACADCLQVCRYHYPAWLIMARCLVVLDQPVHALRCLHLVCRIHPDQEHARVQARVLERALGYRP